MYEYITTKSLDMKPASIIQFHYTIRSIIIDYTR